MPPSLVHLRGSLHDDLEAVRRSRNLADDEPSRTPGTSVKPTHRPNNNSPAMFRRCSQSLLPPEEDLRVRKAEPEDNRPMWFKDRIPQVAQSMQACTLDTGAGRSSMAQKFADDPSQEDARGRYIVSQLQPLSASGSSLIEGYSERGARSASSQSDASRASPSDSQKLAQGAGVETQRGYAAFVQTKMSSVVEASASPEGKVDFGKMQREARAKTSPILASGMNPLRLPALFEKLGHSNVILQGGSSSQHKDGPRTAGIANRQSEEAWKNWQSGMYGNVSLSEGVMQFAKTHAEIKGAFLTFPEEADRLYAGWRAKLGCSGETPKPAALTARQAAASSSAALQKASATTSSAAALASSVAQKSSSLRGSLVDEDTLIRTPSCKQEWLKVPQYIRADIRARGGYGTYLTMNLQVPLL